MNKNEVPIFKTGPNKSFIIGHHDLDGCNYIQVAFKWLKEKIGNDHIIEFRGATYEYVNELALEVFKEADQYRYILIGDISVNEELANKLPPNCFIFDHHDTSKYLETIPNCYWKDSHCGSVIAWMSLYPHIKPSKNFGRLLSLCNIYDMWITGDTGFPRQEAMDLNVLVKKYGYTKFFEKFYDGFSDFDAVDRQIIDTHWKEQDEAILNTEILEYNEEVALILYTDQRLDPNYWCTKFLFEGKKAVLVFYTSSNRLSLRINNSLKGKFHGGFFLKDNIRNNNNSKGGHALAAGCSVEGMSIDEILEVGNKLTKEIEKIKEMSNESR